LIEPRVDLRRRSAALRSFTLTHSLALSLLALYHIPSILIIYLQAELFLCMSARAATAAQPTEHTKRRRPLAADRCGEKDGQAPRVENYLLLFGRAVLIQRNSRGRAQDPTCVAIKTNTAACIIALLAARAAQKFRLRLKNLFLFFASHYELGSVLSAQKRKLAEYAAYCLTRECVCALEF
jgi:hypothetical protein